MSDTNDQPNATSVGTVDAREADKFAAMAESWWDPTGKFKPLHKFNPVRLAFIRDTACSHFDRTRPGDREASGGGTGQPPLPFDGLSLLDIGCGGGLVAEPMARLGATVTGIDAVEKNIKTAAVHAAQSDLNINYRCTTVEALTETGADPFDIVLNLEVVEHVADVDLFLTRSAGLVKPGGIMVLATINRTLKALALAKIGAEYILRWLPMGTHDPRKFVTPDEIRSAVGGAGMQALTETGVSFNPLADKWSLSSDMAVNYMMVFERPALAS